MIDKKTNEEIPSALEKIAKAFAEVMNENQELQRQVDYWKDLKKQEEGRSCKYSDSTAAYIKAYDKLQSQYTQLKEAADEMAEDLIKQSEFLDGYPESVEKYKSIINK